MNRNQRNKKVAEELKYISSGSIYQNMLRASYHNMRRRELGRNPALTKRYILSRAIETVREENRNFTPEYDKKFFDTQVPTQS